MPVREVRPVLAEQQVQPRHGQRWIALDYREHGLFPHVAVAYLPLPCQHCEAAPCESVCPVRIPLPKLMRHWREREFERHLTPSAVREVFAPVMSGALGQ